MHMFRSDPDLMCTFNLYGSVVKDKLKVMPPIKDRDYNDLDIYILSGTECIPYINVYTSGVSCK